MTASPLAVPAGPPAGPPARPLGGWHLGDTLGLSGRALRRSLRTPDTLIMGVTLPVVLLLLFVYVFGGAIGGAGYVDYVVPGIVLLCAGFGASTTAVSVAADTAPGGLLTRVRTMQVRPGAVLTAHVVESLARNAVSTALVVGVAVLAGFRPTAGPGEWLATAGLIGFFVLALTWAAVAIGLVASSPEAASAFSFAVMFLPYVSSAFVDPATMPRALEVVARYQPVTPVADTVRAWLAGAPGGQPLAALAWCLGLFAAARVWAQVAFRRRRRG